MYWIERLRVPPWEGFPNWISIPYSLVKHELFGFLLGFYLFPWVVLSLRLGNSITLCPHFVSFFHCPFIDHFLLGSTWGLDLLASLLSCSSFLLFLVQDYREDEGLNLESDADEQLLIYIPFTQVIKLHSIVIKGPEEEGNCFISRILLFVLLNC